MAEGICVQPGKFISFGITPCFVPTSGIVEEINLQDINLNGSMSSLTGKIPVVQGIPISIEVKKWFIKQENGNDAIEGKHFLAPDGLNGFNASFIFIPSCFMELTNDPLMSLNNAPTRYKLFVEVTISAGAIKTTQDPITLSLSTDLLVSPMAIPTIFTVYKNTHFASFAPYISGQGKALVMVPPNSLYAVKTSYLGLLVS
ncbi:hypothetical protein HFP67_23670 [Bacillus sp. CB102A.1]